MHITIRILLAILLIIDACFIADFNFTHPDNPYDYEKQPEKYDKAKTILFCFFASFSEILFERF